MGCTARSVSLFRSLLFLLQKAQAVASKTSVCAIHQALGRQACGEVPFYS